MDYLKGLRRAFSLLAAKKRWSGNLTRAESDVLSDLGKRIWAATKKPVEERFWEKVQIGDKDSCWVWKACLHYKGYGAFSYNGKTAKSHRVAYILAFGEVPKGQCVCHRCDNPPCCNPGHLFLGTTGDNTRDSVQKGRFVSTKKGETHAKSKFTNDQIQEIRNSYVPRVVGFRKLAKKYNNVAKSTIGSIIRRKTWKHIH